MFRKPLLKVTPMRKGYHARWLSKRRRDALKKSGNHTDCVLLDSLNGFLIVEPMGSNLGDGHVLSRDEADYELRDAWCLDSRKKLQDARRRLGLETESTAGTLAAAL
jgi:hypothetical protein